jgi:HemY protein
MKLLITFILVLVAAVVAALVVLKDPGYVLLAYGTWTVETTLSVFAIVLLVTYGLFYYLVRLLGGAWRLPGRMQDWQRHKHIERARNSFNRGMMALAEGRWKTAERDLLRYVRYTDAPMLNYLAAARAAQQQGEPERRDSYLHLAHESAPAADLAVGLTQAQLQIAHQQLEQALATLTHLRGIEPQNEYVLRLLMKLYRELKDWQHLRELLPDLRKRHVLSEQQLHDLERRVYSELLRQAATSKTPQALRNTWDDTPKNVREEEDLVLEYGSHLMKAKAMAEAEMLLRKSLRRQWSEKMARLYGLVSTENAAEQLSAAEAWLKDHEKSPALLLTLGRLCLRNRLWGKARIYLESSIGAGPRPETYRELGALLEHMGEKDAAMECYRKGMRLAVLESDQPFPETIQLLEHATAAAEPPPKVSTGQSAS